MKLKTTLKTIVVLSAIVSWVIAGIHLFSIEQQRKAVLEQQHQIFIANTQQAELSFTKAIQLKAKESERFSTLQADFQGYSKQQKAGSLFMISIPGTSADKVTLDFINKNRIGGVILMGGNVVSASQLKQLTSDLKTKSDHALVIAIDQEGYPVSRISWEQYAEANAAELGRNSTIKDITEINQSRAAELKELGIDLNFSPVADLQYTGSWIKDRSYGSDPEKVGNIISAIITTAADAGMKTNVKHFPGLGNSDIDSHEFMPVIKESKEQLLNKDIQPFKSAIDTGVDYVMAGHALYPAFDKTNPATVSRSLLTEILRNKLKFSGLIITDDMKMGALNHINNKYSKSLQAGSDVLLLIDSFENIKKAISSVSDSDLKLLDHKVKRQLYLSSQ